MGNDRDGERTTSDEATPAASPRRPSGGVCLAVPTTESFLPGALTTIGSFLRQHPRFDGDVVVIHDGLSGRSREYLQALSDRVRLVALSSALHARVERLPASFHTAPGRQTRLYSLDAFRLTGYRKVLCCDADLLFRQPVDELFAAEGELLCCGDGAHLRKRSPGAATFNSGFMLIDERLIGDGPFADLVALVTSSTWSGADEPTTDQLVLNRYFGGRPTLVGWTYNYLLAHAGSIMAREGLAWRGAKVLHFNLSTKPWLSHTLTERALRALPLPLLPAFRIWHDAWLDCLTAASLRSTRRAARGGGGP